jgi:hypothetical protein
MRFLMYAVSVFCWVVWIGATIGIFAAAYTVAVINHSSAAWGFFAPALFIFFVAPIGGVAYWNMGSDGR